jgi:hypothetical protein
MAGICHLCMVAQLFHMVSASLSSSKNAHGCHPYAADSRVIGSGKVQAGGGDGRCLHPSLQPRLAQGGKMTV